MVGGAGGALLAGIVYEPKLTLGLPRATTVGTALNALAHSAEALYSRQATEQSDETALAGAAAISRWLPRVVECLGDEAARKELLEGAMRAGAALAASSMGLGHAMAQALGGRYGIPHGAMRSAFPPRSASTGLLSAMRSTASPVRLVPTTPSRAWWSWPVSAASSGSAT